MSRKNLDSGSIQTFGQPASVVQSEWCWSHAQAWRNQSVRRPRGVL